MRQFDIVLAGVGGQGTLLAAEALGVAAVKDDLNVRVGEIHGMAQRGGAVVSTVRIGQNVLSPTVVEGCADVVLGFEPFETLRNLKYASAKTLILMNTLRIPPTELAAKNIKYPEVEQILQIIRRFTEKVILVEAADLAKKAGNTVTQNVVLLGALAATKVLPLRTESLLEAVRELVPAKHVETNLKAFDLGFKSARVEKKEV